MESLELRIFMTAAKEGSISGAAEKLNYVQSNVTAHIKKLEEELGTTLFIRHGKGVTITENGQRLLCYAQSVIQLLDSAVADFQKKVESLKIGTTQTLAASRLPQWVADFSLSHPTVNVSSTTENQSRLSEQLESGAIDCAFMEPKFMNSHVKSLLNFEEKLCIIAPTHCTQAMLKHMPLIVNHIETCSYRKLLSDWIFSECGKMPKMIEFDTVEAILSAVSLGMGISLLPRRVVAQKKNVQRFHLDGIDKAMIHMVTLCNQQNKHVYEFMETVRTSLHGKA